MGDKDHISEIRPRMTRRRFGWDYTQRAIYMITLTLADRSHEWLGKLILADNGEALHCANSIADNGESRHRATNRAPLNNGAIKSPNAALMACNPHPGAGVAAAHPCAAKIASTKFGLAALEALYEMEMLYPQVKIIESQLMPEHMHFVIFVREKLDKPLGALIRGFKAGAAKRWKLLADNGEAPHYATEGAPPSNGAIDDREPCLAPHYATEGAPLNHGAIESGNADLKACDPHPGAGAAAAHPCAAKSTAESTIPQWAKGFNDTILFRDGQLGAMLDYVRDNPRRLAEKRAKPGHFSRVTMLSLPLDGGRITGKFEALGNRHLLNLPLVQVQCSRRHFAYRRIPKPGGGAKIAKDAAGEPIVERSSPEYQARLDAMLTAASHGAAVLSPCISDGEKQIAREALKRNIPLIALKNMGFAKCEKPQGRLFEACANGRLLLLAPAAWPYSTQAKAMTRFDATALNRIAQWLAGEYAVEVNYRGMLPHNIDRLAEEAVMASSITPHSTHP